MFKTSLLTILAAGCIPSEPLVDYYSGRSGPEISGLDVTTEPGNVGGTTVVISGSGFGTTVNGVVVLFGQHNATVESVTDSAVVVTTPPGPISGGSVQVRLATKNGTASWGSPDDETGYVYDVGSLYDNQKAYIVVQNFRDIAYDTWYGYTGIDGYAEFLDMVYPRYHTQNLSSFPGTDVGRSEDWVVQRPGQVNFIWGLDEFMADVDGFDHFVIRNEGNLGQTSCVRPNTLDAANCRADDVVEYDLEVLQFCETAWQDPADRGQFRAEWPVDADFFTTGSSGGVDVILEAPELGLDALPLTLPPKMEVWGTSGFGSNDDTEGNSGGWAAGQFEACFDSPERPDHDTTLDDVAVRLEWVPFTGESITDRLAVEVGGGPEVKDVQTQVRLSITAIAFGWIGPEGYPVRATVVVPDDNNFDRNRGTSYVDIPVSTLYQFPTTDIGFGGSLGMGGGSDPTDPRWGYLLVSMDRVTEYRIESEVLDGDVVLAYVTGDMGIFDWQNPLDEEITSCNDCLDNDGDGWVDADDPDCEDGGDENDPRTDYTCNDGVDNDGDGDIDSEDEDCTSATAQESGQCSDGEDNDGDGWEDRLDPDCVEGFMEDGSYDALYTCADGIDNDGDGWIDGDDLACNRGTDSEDDGYYDADGDGDPDYECNDGIDNDGHGDVDSDDLVCFVKGADYAVESPAMSGACVDGEDGDGDGYIDEYDPGCEYSPYSSEGGTSDDPEARPATNQCYDGIDNDEDGLMDSEDPGCINQVSGMPDGFLDDESAG